MRVIIREKPSGNRDDELRRKLHESIYKNGWIYELLIYDRFT